MAHVDIVVKHRLTGKVIISGKYKSIRDCLEKNWVTDLCNSDLHNADLFGADLCNADLDFSQLQLSCKTLLAKFDNRITTQILYHAAKAAERNKNINDNDLLELLKDEKFTNVINKFHRVDECGKYNPMEVKNG